MEEGNLAWDGVGEKFEWKAICQSSPRGGVRWWGLEVEVVLLSLWNNGKSLFLEAACSN